MRRLHVLPRLLLSFSYQFRLGMVLLAFLLSTLLFALGFPGRLNGSLLGIPIALAVWLFKRQGALMSITSTLLVIMLVNSITTHSIAWPPSLLTSFTAGVFALLAEALIIGCLRNALDISDAARLQAQQAEDQLLRAFEQQKQLNQLKDQLLVHINHELRTPLTGALGYLELLQDFGTSLDAATSSTFLRNAYRNCLELQFLVNNVLDAMNTQQKDALPTPERLPVLRVVHEVLEQFDPRVKAGHSLFLDIPEHLTVCANKHYIHQVLRNLLSNAFTYAPTASQVSISATPHVSDTPGGDAILICVKDVGPGIPPEELPLLFGQFVRLKRDMGGSVRGTGLGLYVSKQLVQALGGTIWVESTGVAGQGSRFCVILPTVSPHMLSLPASATDHELSPLSRDKPPLE